MSDKLSPTMLDAIAFANKNGGKLIRYPGGFWCKDGLMERQGRWFGTSTVEALVKRGAASYTKWHEGAGVRFPIEVTIQQAAEGVN